ncbi:hypothetical protein KJ359_003493 [Pestalotiopsis sp. 9143b]|nr:hypothetical protein KJ359_003493 [Pestalotiopsis sp. 9143b]
MSQSAGHTAADEEEFYDENQEEYYDEDLEEENDEDDDEGLRRIRYRYTPADPNFVTPFFIPQDFLDGPNGHLFKAMLEAEKSKNATEPKDTTGEKGSSGKGSSKQNSGKRTRDPSETPGGRGRKDKKSRRSKVKPEDPESDPESGKEFGPEYDPLNVMREETRQLRIISNNPKNIALLPDTWAGHFRGFPIPDALFYKKTQTVSTWPRIYEHTDGQDYHGSKVFLSLVKVQSRIRDIRDEYLVEQNDPEKDHIGKREDARKFRARYVKALKPVLEKSIQWAWKDGKLEQFEMPRTVLVFDVAHTNSQSAAIEGIRKGMDSVATEWRSFMAEQLKEAANLQIEVDKEAMVAPVLFGFAIMEHNVIVVHLDASDEKAKPYFHMNLAMDTTNQRQWFALMIMVIVCYARDKAMALATKGNLEAFKADSESDPDA